MISFKLSLKSLIFISKKAYHTIFLYENYMISIFKLKIKNNFTLMVNISKSSDYIPNLIISSFDSTYDQFQMIPEFFNFYLEKGLSYNFHI